MNLKDVFENEINLIKHEDLKEFARYYFDDCNHYIPKYFAKIGASSSGKYHPKFSQGEGGLINHTKAVVMFAQELLRMNCYAYMKDEYKDYVILACLCHDIAKYGLDDEMNKDEYKYHAENGADNLIKAFFDYFGVECPFVLINAVKSHMGQWSTEPENRPFTNVDRCVHLADYIASRNFIDIPSLNKEGE